MSKKFGFTLAEVLITLGIIGVVASMTIPTLITNYNQRAWDTGATVFNRKLGEALKVMNSQSSLAGFTTTRAFVDELSKHIKIVKTCDSNELTDCFTSEIATGAEPIDTSKLKAAKNLNSSGKYGTETIGVQFADGVSALIAYNPNATQDPYSNQIVNVTGSGNNVGLGTDALAILYDVSGAKSPNSYGSGKDVRGINVAIKIGADFLDIGTNYTPVNCSNSSGVDYKYCGSNPSGKTTDYWAGAIKACENADMRLPKLQEIKDLYAKKDEEDLPTYVRLWSMSEFSATSAWYYVAGSGDWNQTSKSYSTYSVLCVGN